MIIEGKYNTAKIFTEVVDEIAVSQIKTLCDSEIFASSKIRVMPDVHAGASCTIGTTMTITDKIIPNMVGVDIGCGMECANLGKVEINLERLDNLIYERIPAGMEVRAVEHEFCAQIDLSKLRCYRNINEYRAKLSIGTLGGGNHFIEMDVDDDGNKYLVVHSGSRHLGTEVAEYYQKEAFRRLSGNSNKQIQELITKLKEEGRQKEIQSTVNALMAQKTNIPESMAYVENELFEDYVFDMKLVQYFANLNRKAIMREIVDGLNLDVKEQFSTIHNYLDTDYMIMRKGAVSAKKGEKLLIPINMRDGALICIGKGNEDWNCSAPHGAGRLLSRGKARATLSVEEFVREMDGIYSTSVNRSTLDESPMAYKSIADIVNNIAPTVDIINRIRPIYNFKSSEQVD